MAINMSTTSASDLSPGVYVQEISNGTRPIQAVGTRTAGFVGTAPWADAPTEATLVTNWTQFRNLFFPFSLDPLPNQASPVVSPWTDLAYAVYGFFLNGGSRCYVVNVGKGTNGEKPLISGGGGTPVGLDLLARVDEVAIVAAPGFTSPTDYAALIAHCDGLRDRVAILDGPNTILSQTITSLGSQPPALALPAPVNNKQGSKSANQQVGQSVGKSAPGSETSGGGAAKSGSKSGGSQKTKTVTVSSTTVKAEAPLSKTVKKQSAASAAATPVPWQMAANSDYGQATMYVPWIQVGNPVRQADDKILTIPPSGHIAGVWARTDATRGVFKAPANESVRGAVGLAYQFNDTEQAALNNRGVNVIRFFSNQGILVWGARTLTKDPNFRYLNVRRLFNMIEESIAEGTRWIVFEPNAQPLWRAIRRDVSSFLLGFWRDGALMGSTPQEAFYVKCDAENNPFDSINEGKVIIDIGIAPVRPAEFVFFRISQYEAGSEIQVSGG